MYKRQPHILCDDSHVRNVFINIFNVKRNKTEHFIFTYDCVKLNSSIGNTNTAVLTETSSPTYPKNPMAQIAPRSLPAGAPGHEIDCLFLGSVLHLFTGNVFLNNKKYTGFYYIFTKADLVSSRVTICLVGQLVFHKLGDGRAHKSHLYKIVELKIIMHLDLHKSNEFKSMR